MEIYEVHTEEDVHGVYRVEADSAEQARRLFEMGLLTRPAVFESMTAQIVEVKVWEASKQ